MTDMSTVPDVQMFKALCTNNLAPDAAMLLLLYLQTCAQICSITSDIKNVVVLIRSRVNLLWFGESTIFMLYLHKFVIFMSTVPSNCLKNKKGNVIRASYVLLPF